MSDRIGEKKFNPEALAKETEEASQRFTRQRDIERLKAHCSLLRTLPDRVVEELYKDWSISWSMDASEWLDPEDDAGFYYNADELNIEVFTEHCIKLWSGEGS